MSRMLSVLAVASIATATPAIAVPAGCPSIPNAQRILKPGMRVLLGEMHGNHETPQFVADLACNAAALGALRIGLEMPMPEQARVDAFLTSAGTLADRQALLAGPFWTRDYQDGRTSTAMLALLDSLRRLAKGGTDIKVIAFDLPLDAPTDHRDQVMARNLAAAFASDPRATFLVLVGNLHARKAPHPAFKQTFMAQYLVEMKEPVTTLDVRYGTGTSWMCMPTCGPHAIGHGPAAPVGVALRSTKDDAYDGTFSIGTPTFAPPAARP